MAIPAAIASAEGSAGRAMRLARLQTAVVIATPGVAEAVWRTPAGGALGWRLGEPLGEGKSSRCSSRLGDTALCRPSDATGRKKPRGASPRLGEWSWRDEEDAWRGCGTPVACAAPIEGLTKGLERRVLTMPPLKVDDGCVWGGMSTVVPPRCSSRARGAPSSVWSSGISLPQASR